LGQPGSRVASTSRRGSLNIQGSDGSTLYTFRNTVVVRCTCVAMKAYAFAPSNNSFSILYFPLCSTSAVSSAGALILANRPRLRLLRLATHAARTPSIDLGVPRESAPSLPPVAFPLRAMLLQGLTRPSQFEGLTGAKPFRISEGYPRVF